MTNTEPSSPWEIRDFRLFQCSRFFITLAVQMQSVAIGWQVYDLTHSALSLGLVGLFTFLPLFIFSLVTGHVADRYDRRHVLLACFAVLVVCAGMLLTLALQPASESLVPLIYTAVAIFGVTRAFFGPSAAALGADLVSAALLPRAVAWSSTTWQFASILGPALGGWVYAFGNGAWSVYLLCLVLYSVSLMLIYLMNIRKGGLDRRAITRELLLAGIRYVFERKIILGAISLDLFAVLLGGSVALLPIFASDILKVGPSGLGVLRSAPAVGATIVALFLARRPLNGRVGSKLFISVFVFGLATCVFGLSENFWLSLLALAVLGGADMVSVVIRQTLIQLSTPAEMRGRVTAVSQVFISASNELGEFESGLTAAWFGVVPAVIIGGLGTCAVVLAWAVKFPMLREVDNYG